MVNQKIFKAYDIRGIYPTEINEEVVADVISAIYTFFVRDIGKSRLTVVLGHDMRVSSPALYDVALKTLMSFGARIVAIRLSSTPTMYSTLMTTAGADVGIQINASHNPANYNGVKFAKRVGDTMIKVSGDFGMPEIKKIVAEKDFVNVEDGGEIIEAPNALADEVDFVTRKIMPHFVKPLKIVADPANAMGTQTLPVLFNKLGIDLEMINRQLDGTFPVHQPDPLQFELYDKLGEEVVARGADLGIAPDGDADRVYFLDEKGKIIPATYISSLITRQLLKTNPQAQIVVDVRYIKNVEGNCKKLGGHAPHISKVGHSFITALVNNTNSVFAGESSGHFYYKDFGGAESSLLTILHVLKVMEEEQKPISEIVAALKVAEESGEFNYTLPDGVTGAEFLAKIESSFAGATFGKIDGLTIDKDNWRANIRTSNTEPLLRLNVEAFEMPDMQAGLEQTQKVITELGASPKTSSH